MNRPRVLLAIETGAVVSDPDLTPVRLKKIRVDDG